MNRMKHSIAAIVTVAALATGALVVTSFPSAAADAEMPMATTAAEHAAEAAKYDQEAVELDAKADEHTRLARQNRTRLNSGGKQVGVLRSMSKHCERLAKSYRAAATEAREMAKMHREMAQAA